MPSNSWVKALFIRHKKSIFLAHLYTLLGTFLAVPVPMLLPLLVDEVLLDQPGFALEWMGKLVPEALHGPVTWIMCIVLVALVLRLGALVFQVLQSKRFNLIAKDVVFRLRKQLLGHLGVLSMHDWASLGSGGASARLVTDLQTLDTFISTALSKLLISVLVIIGTALILLWIHWGLALFILLLNPLVVAVTVMLGRRVKELKREENQAIEVFQNDLTEILDALPQYRISNRTHYIRKHLLGRATDVKATGARYAWQSDAASRLSFTVFVMGIDCFRAAAMVTVLLSDLSIGQMFAVFGYLWFMMIPVSDVLAIQYQWYAAKAAWARCMALFELKPETQYPNKANPFTANQGIEIGVTGLSHAYEGSDQGIKDVSFSVKAGECIGIVGQSGSGKSTLINVLTGLYAPDAGEIKWGNAPHTQVSLETLRDHVAVVLQEPVLLNSSVRDNLTLGESAEDEALWQALDLACIGHQVRQMPKGLDTVLGRRGVRLSGGQRQRLAIARMLLTKPSVVILDEATSALDTQTERQVMNNLREVLADQTLLVIAHRQSAMVRASKVLVFEAGRLVEQGNMNDLLQRKEGIYHWLYASEPPSLISK